MTLLRVLLLTIVSVSLVSCHRQEASSSQELTVFAAASLTDAMTEIGELFEEETDCSLVFNFAGSGALARQILAAPRADVFLSANRKWMNEVESANLLLAGSRISLLSNQLVVIQNPNANYRWGSPSVFIDQPFRYLSIGDPASVPAGRYAQQWLEGLSAGPGDTLWDLLQNRISPATDVRSALFQVRSNHDVVGIVYQTDAKAYPEAVKILFTVPIEEGPKISYPAAILGHTDHPELAREFLTFLQGDKARKVFGNLGFVVQSSPH
ncbi:molybdate ABC transporter substrate-binding protein [Puniceicoccus vermicola]|uniref:Molybdate-binding protein ModA n=1 Tax=Puniceicoccus vermicola TaxID=388746 RepID=A0A7X1AY93_9BACT|nr:molybdate ABC transporter substrate-binding protein [Puniceicoccus vermicola]MBC2602172.1 molybdate ABC transporter substrate-binding protein [Puniceicoccus vermicola]